MSENLFAKRASKQRKGCDDMSFEVWRLLADAPDDPPRCGVQIAKFDSHAMACGYADETMRRERSVFYSYFVLDSTGREGFYSTGYVSE